MCFAKKFHAKEKTSFIHKILSKHNFQAFKNKQTQNVFKDILRHIRFPILQTDTSKQTNKQAETTPLLNTTPKNLRPKLYILYI